AAEFGGQRSPHPLDVPVDQRRVVDRQLILRVEVVFERVVHDSRRGRVVAVIEVDEGPVRRVRLLNGAPVSFVLRHFVGGAIGDGGRGRRDAGERGPRRGDR